jgi:hypothetical protein
MDRIGPIVGDLNRSEEGHALPGLGALLGAAGAVMLGFGAAGDNDAIAIVGGIVAGVGILAASVLEHMNVDYNVFDRLEKLEKK